MNFKKLLLFLAAPLMLVMNSCVDEGPDYSLPSIAITDADSKDVTTVNFPAEGGEQKILITATRSWNIAYTSDWFAVNPSSDSNEAMAAKVVEVTITAGPNTESEGRNETIKVTMDKTEKSILISQAGEGQVALGEVLYYENFDKDGQQAQKGSSGWDTYLDGNGAAYLNPTPENQAGVTYAGTKVSIRSNSANGSAGTHSNCADVASGLNYVWFGTAPTNMTVSGISLAELEGNALTLSFTTERYEYEATDNTFKNDEFKVYISGDGEKWSEVEYTFLDGVNLNGKWNIATAQFNLKEVPETLSIYFTASVGSAYAIDDVKLTAGGGGVEIDLSQGGEISGTTGGGTTSGDVTGNEPDPNAVTATVLEFLNAAEDDTVYLLTGTISGNVTTYYGNFDLTDETGTVYIYGLVDSNNKFIWDDLGLKVGDTITIQGTRTSYKDTPQMKNALYISHVVGEGGNDEPDVPVVAEGDYASDAAFVQATDDSANAVYSLGESAINNSAVTGFKLGTSSKTGVFTSASIGVSGDLYLNFYAVAWKGKTATLYWRVNGGEAMSQALVANTGATNNPPFTAITLSDSDHYSVKLTGLTATDVIEFSTDESFSAVSNDSSGRAIVFGVKLTEEALGGSTGGTTPEPEDPDTPTELAGTGEGTEASPYDVTRAKAAIDAYSTVSGVYVKGIITSSAITFNSTYSSCDYYISEDGTTSNELMVYSGKYLNGEAFTSADQIHAGDEVVVYGDLKIYNGIYEFNYSSKIVTLNCSHSDDSGDDTTEPEDPETPAEVAEISVEDFLLKDVDATVWYKLTGTISNIANTTYGNFDLTDETGTVYVYGLTATQVESNDKSFSTLGLKEGDIVTLIGTRAAYYETAQVGGPAYYVSRIEGETPEVPANVATISFADVANRTSFSTEQQVWEQNGITVTNDKGSSTNDVADYSGPARFYAGSNITIEAEKEMSQIVFNCSGSKNLSLSDGEGYTVSGSGTSKVTITLTTPATSFVITGLSAQVRVSSIDVTYAE